MAILVLLECRVDRESVCANNIHVIKYAVVDSGVGATGFHFFSLDLLAKDGTLIYHTWTKRDRFASRRCDQHHGAFPFLPPILINLVKFFNGFYCQLLI